MGLRDLFSAKDPEVYEKKGDVLYETNAFGKAIVEFERALEKLEKTAPWDDGYRQSLQEKIRNSKEALAQEHKKTADDLVEAGHVDDARQYITLALELTDNQELKSILEGQEKNLDAHQIKEIEVALADSASSDQESEPDQEFVHEDTEDEYFRALIGTLPEEVQDAYLSYPEVFKAGYLALNRGDFELAAEHLAQAAEQLSDPQSYIPLELATAHLNLGELDKARRLLESFLHYHPDALPAYQLLCEIFWETNAFDQADALLSFLPQDLAESTAGFLLRGETLFQAKKYGEAKTFYREFLRTYDWNEPIALALAKTHEALGEMANARNMYREIMQQCQSCHARINPSVKQKFADLSFASGLNTTEVLEIYLSLARQLPENAADYYQKISQIYSAQGNHEEARRFERIVEKYVNRE
jgi:tetratricopeptide (TPR) repeat protein